MRKPYASDPGKSGGRYHAEAASPSRTVFQRDRDRVLHSTAFRRLKDKTQVFLYDEGDHYRTRLTHTLEVAQIARSLARTLRLDEDLAEALSLAHDLGHTPFGHAGERALAREMAEYGGFDHNAQSLRVVTALERRYPEFDGLNLTWECLEGLVKHNGPLTDSNGAPIGRYADHGLPEAVASYNAVQDLGLAQFAGPEAQVAAISDDIAYNAHDVDDGLRAGFLTLEDVARTALIGDLLAGIQSRYPGLVEERVRAELVRRMISAMIGDVAQESARRFALADPGSVEDIRGADGPMVALSEPMAAHNAEVQATLTEIVYRNERIVAVMGAAERIVSRLFLHFLDEPAALPGHWQAEKFDGRDAKARRIADFIAGMTDRYAIIEYQRLFGEAPDLA
jgi:dGTPase